MASKQMLKLLLVNVLLCIFLNALLITCASCAEGDPCWKKVYEKTDANGFVSIWGSSSSAVYAVGSNGYILFYDGIEWSVLDPKGLNFTLDDVWGLSSESVYFVAHKILHYDGSSWEYLLDGLTERNYNAIWGSEEDDMYLVGSNNVDDYGVIHHYDGVSWSEVKTTEYPLYHVWGTSSDDVYVSGSHEKLYHYDGYVWEEVELPISSDGAIWMRSIGDIWGRADDDIYIGGKQVLHFNGNQWEEVKTDGGESLGAGSIHGQPLGRVAAISGGRQVFLIDGLEAREVVNMGNKSSIRLLDVWVSEKGLVYAAGSRLKGEYEIQAVIYRYSCDLEQ